MFHIERLVRARSIIFRILMRLMSMFDQKIGHSIDLVAVTK